MRTNRWLLAVACLASLLTLCSCIGLRNLLGRAAIEGAMGSRDAEADGPDKAHKWRALAWKDKQGNILPGSLEQAQHQIFALAALTRHVSRTPGPQPYWVERGPTNIPGRTLCMLISPTNPNRLMVGTAGGGIWTSPDGGQTWALVSDKLPSLAISALTMDPNNPNVIYAGTGEGFFNDDAIQGFGMLVSTNGGSTWASVSSTTGFGNVNSIVVSPFNSSTIVFGGDNGIFRSTDGGATWTKTFSAYSCRDLHVDPFNPNHLVACGLNYNTTSWFNEGIYSNDGGATWSTANSLVIYDFDARFSFSFAPSAQGTVYATVGTYGSSGSSGGDMYKSTDGGQTYALVTTSTAGTSAWGTAYGWYTACTWVDPTNSNFIVAAGATVLGSKDGGQTISEISDYWANPVHADVHFITASPGFDGVTNRRVYACTDGGVFVADNIYNADGFGGWRALTNGERSTQFYAAQGDANIGLIIGGCQDQGTIGLFPGDNLGTSEWGGDGGWTAIDPMGRAVFGEYVSTGGGNGVILNPFRIMPDGSGNYINYDQNYNYDLTDNDANFVPPMVMDPNNPQQLYIGATSLWGSSDDLDGFPVWTQDGPEPATDDPISAIAVAPGSPSTIWFGRDSGIVMMKTASTNWQQVLNAGQYVGRILIDPANINTVYVAMGGFTPKNLQVTHDGGKTWASASGTGATALPSAPIRGIARDPANANHLFVGTEVGICESMDAGTTWSAPSAGPLNVSVDELNYMVGSNKLIAATHGRGIWLNGVADIATLSLPASVPSGSTFQGAITLDQPAPSGGIVVSLTSANSLITAPASVTVPAGQWSVAFSATAGSVVPAEGVAITASYGASTKTSTVTVQQVRIRSVSANPSTVIGGNTANLTLGVSLTAAAPAGGATVNLASSNPSVTVPSTLVIAAGKTSGTASGTVNAITSDAVATVTASLAASSSAATVSVFGSQPSTVSISPSSLVGGATSTGTVTLSAAAPPAGLTVQIRSSTASATVPTSVVVAGGNTSATFAIATKAVSQNVTATISAIYGSKTAKGTLTITAPTLVSLTISPTSVQGSSSTAVTGTVTLSSAAPAGGTSVSLSSSNTAAASAASTVSVPAGALTATFSIKHSKVSASTTVTFTAKLGTVTQTAKLTVTP